eukprot:7677896-Pyramimonas_sp.AAC.1
MCACSGGSIPCHTANVRLRGAARKRRAHARGSSLGSEDDLNRSGSAGASPNGADPFSIKREPVSQLVSSTSASPEARRHGHLQNKRFRQTKVPNVVGQLIQANVALREQ